MSQTHGEEISAKSRVSASQWKGFFGAFGGWVLDGFNQSIFGLVLAPAMAELLPKSGYAATPQMIGYFGELAVAIFLAGWGCSFLLGPVADRMGRVPTMMFCILVYAVFTCLTGFSQNIWQLFLFRFIAAVGLGGEWTMAGTLVAETMPERHRPFFGGLLHSGVYVGMLLGAAVNYVIGVHLGWRWMFYLGLIPAVFVLYIRSQTPEPERWVKVSGEARKTPYWVFLGRVLRPPYRRRTWINVVLLSAALVGAWAGSQYLGATIVNLAARQGMENGAGLHLATLGLGLLSVVSFFGCLLGPVLAQRLGRRHTLALTYALMILGLAGGYGWGYYAHNMAAFFVFIPILGIANADFAIFTVWLPEQYSTDVRATAFAFCTTISHFVAAGATFLVGYAISQAHTIGYPLALTALPFVLGIFLCYLAPETRGQPLPE